MKMIFSKRSRNRPAVALLLLFGLLAAACLEGDNGLDHDSGEDDPGDGWASQEQVLEGKVLGDLLVEQTADDLLQAGETLRDAIHAQAETGLFQCPEAGTVEVVPEHSERQLQAENCLDQGRVQDGEVQLSFGGDLRDFHYQPLEDGLRVEHLDGVGGVLLLEGEVERQGGALEQWLHMEDLSGELLLGGDSQAFRIDSLELTREGGLPSEWEMDFAISGLEDRCDVGSVHYQRRIEEVDGASARQGELVREEETAEYHWEDAETLRITADGRTREFSLADYRATAERCLP